MALPPGFILDSETKPTTLPPGFKLDTDIEKEDTSTALGLVKRFGKQFYNAFAVETAASVPSVLQRTALMLANPGMTYIPTARELKASQKITKKLQSDVPQAVSIPEKVTDVTADIGAFIAQVALLKKIVPAGTSEKTLWEVQNLLSGGNPGEGAAMHTAFGLPGKLIKGTTIAAKAGRLAAESTTMGGLSVVEQKLTTGEINWEDVAISAGIPVGLRSLAYVKAGFRKGDPKITKAIADLHPELLERMPNLRTVLSVTPQQRTGALGRFARYAGKEPLPGQLTETVSAQPDILSMPGGAQTLEQTAGKPTTFGREPNLYRTVSGSRTGITEQEVGRIGERYVDKVTGEDIIPDIVQPVTAVAEGRGGKAKTITVSPSKRKGLAPTLIEEQPALIPTTVGDEMPVGISRTSTKVSQWWDSAPAKEAEAKLGQWTKEIVPVGQAEREAAVGELRKQQAAGGFAAFRQAWKGAQTSGGKLKALLKIKSGFGGKAEVPEFTPPDLTGAQWDIFAARAKEVYVGKSIRDIFELSTVGDALNKIKRGFVPTPYEFGLLKPVLGSELTTKIWEATRGLEPVDIWGVAETMKDGFKALPLGVDIQARRQGSTIAWRHPIIRAQMFIAGTRGYFPWFKGGDPYTKRISEIIEKDSNYKKYTKEYKLNWVSTDPWATVEAGTKIQSYGRFPQWLARRKFAPARKMGEWLMASERGSVAGINIGLKLLGDVAEKELQLLRIKKPMTPEQVRTWRIERGKTINAALKRIVAHSQAGKRLQSAANWMLISPSHTVSRPYLRWRAFSTLFSKKSGDWKGKTYAAQLYGLSLLRTTAIGTIFGYIGQKLFFDDPSEAPAVDGSANPLNPLWGKARWGNHVFDYTGGDVNIDRDLARLAISGYFYGQDLIAGYQQTKAWGANIPSVGSTIVRHFTNKEAMHFAFLKTILTGKDWLGRDIESWEAITRAITPTQLVSIFEAWSEDGILEALAQRDPYEVGKDIVASAAVGLAEMMGEGAQSYAVPAYQQERMFLDEMSVRKHNLKWDYLSPVQHARLKIEHRDILTEFDEQKKLERIENPYDPSKLIEEQRKTGKRIKAKLDEPVQQLLEDIDLSVGRGQNNFMLNDKRFNRYQDKLVEKLNELIPKTRADRLPPGPARRKALESIVQKSKKAAFGELMKEINQ